MKLILSMIKKHSRGFLLALFFLVVEASCDLLQPTMMSKIVDDAVASRDTKAVLTLGAVMVLIALCGALGAVGRNYFASNISQNVGRELRSDVYRKIQSFSFENIDKLDPASLVTRMTNDVTQIQNFINGCMRIMVKAPITCIGAIVFIIIQTPTQIPMLAGVLVVAGFLILMNMKLGYPRFHKVQESLDKLNMISREYLNSVRVVKAFSREQFEYDRFADTADELSDASLRASRVNVLFAPLISLAVNAGIVAMLWIGGYGGGAAQVGELMAAVNYMTQILFALGMVSNVLNMLVRATASSNRVQEVLQEVPSMSTQGEVILQDLSKGICFDHVSFHYPCAMEPALRDIQFTLKQGQTCGIIGATGSGKSSLINLIPRFYDATQGRILIGGQEIRHLNIRALRRQIAVVSQKAVLFTGTIAANLRWGDQDATQEQLQSAAAAAAADEFISGFPEGYETILGQGGVNLSGGQKQRLSIARAIVRRPQLLLLDDCTSALDATTEAKVMRGIRAYSQDITTLVVSQKISSVRTADMILCMDKGCIVGMGTHEQLLESCPIYRAIYDSQIGGDQIG